MRLIIFSLLISCCFASCSNYGDKATKENIEVFYKDPVTKDEAQKTADLFYESLKASSPGTSDKKSFQLTQTGDTITLKMVAKKEKVESVPEEAFYRITNMVSESVFNNKPVNIVFTDNRFKGFRTLAFKKITVDQEYGEKYVADKVEVFAKGVDGEVAQKLANLLNDDINPEKGISFQFANEDGAYVVRMVISGDINMNDITNESMEELSKKISEKILDGAPLTFKLTDSEFKEKRSFNYNPETQPADPVQ